MLSVEILSRLGILLFVFVVLTFCYWHVVQWISHRWRKRSARIILLITAALVAAGTLFLAGFFYVYHGFGHQPDIYRSGNRTSNMVAFTFDDGPSADFTPAILDILQQYDVPATFFMVGSHVEKYPEIARRIVDDGHIVGSHTQNHTNVPTLSAGQLHQELMEATAAILDITGEYPAYVRPPRGLYDGRFRRLANLMGQEIVLWTISSRDWRYGVSPQSIVKNVINQVRGGDIILFHDSGALIRSEGGDRRATVIALPEIIEAIYAKGLEIVPLDILLYGHEPEEVFPQVNMPE